MRFLITFFAFSLWSFSLIGQSATCNDPSPLCSIPGFDIPLGSNIPMVLGDYGCFTGSSSSLPSINGYYYVEATTSGTISLNVNSPVSNLSIVAWGPFTSIADASSNCTRLPAPVACSAKLYSNSESISINALAGEFYLVFITGDAPPAYAGQFTLTQGSGPGFASTTCNVQNVDLGCAPDILLNDCNEDVPDAFATALDMFNAGGDFDDFCSDRIALTFKDSDNDGIGCASNQRIVQREYFAMDQCGNIGSCTQRIFFPVLQGPLELICPPSNAPSQLVTCLDDLVVNVQDIIAADGCGTELSFDIGEPQINDTALGLECDFTCLHYPITVTDECGRVGECTLSFTVFGNVPEFINDIDDDEDICRLAPLDVNCYDDIEDVLDSYLDTLSVFSTCGNGTSLTTDFDPDNFVTVCSDSLFQSQEIIITSRDACGRESTCIGTINVIKLEGPSIPVEAKDKWVSCSENVDSIFQAFIADNGGAIAIDFCSGVTFTTNPVNPVPFIACDGEEGLTVEFIASDECGNSASTSSLFKVNNDTEISIVNEAESVSVECTSDLNTLFDDFINNNAGLEVIACGNVTYTTDPVNPTAPSIDNMCNDGVTTVTFTATDECGQEISSTATFAIEDTTAPDLMGGSNLDLICDMDTDSAIEAWLDSNGGISATDACSDVSISNDFQGLDIDDICNDETVAVTFTATDACGNPATQTLEITVSDDTAPTLSGGDDLNLMCGSDTDASIQAWLDNNGGLTATDDCSEVTITNDFDGIDLSMVCHDPIVVTFTVTDECGNETTQTQVINITDNTPPVFTFIPTTIDEVAIAVDECSDVTITVMDEMNGGQIIRTITATDACGNSTSITLTFGEVDNTPPVLVFIPAEIGCNGVLDPDDVIATDDSGNVTVTVVLVSETGSCTTGFTFVYEVTATDDAGNMTTETVTYNIPPDFEPPVITNVPTDLTFTCDEEVVIPEPTVTDNCGDVTLTCVETLNEFAVVDDCNNGFGFDITKVWTATDICGNTATAVTLAWVVPVDYTGPRFEFVPEDRVMECGDDTTFGDAVCTTFCGDVVLTFEDEFIQADCTQDGQMIRTWTGRDDCGNVSTASQTITIPADTEAPVFTNVPASSMINNIDDMVFGTPTCIDNCASIDHLDIDFVDTPLEIGCGVTRTWTVSDMCGNAAQASQTFTIDDDEAPFIDIDVALIEVPCGTTAEFSQPAIADNMGEVEIVITDANEGENCIGLPDLTRTWTATDMCGNVSNFTQTMRMIDADAPIFEALAREKVITCNDEFTFDQAVANDACTDLQSLVFEDENITEPFCTDCISATLRTWTATDACGNQSNVSQTLLVRDQEAPNMNLTVASTIELACGEELNIIDPTVSDNCGQVELSFEDINLEGQCTSKLSFIRTWIATDMVGNQTAISQSFIYIDSEAPVFGVIPEDLTLTCSQEIPTIIDALVVATDNCDQNVEITVEESFIDGGDCAQSNTIVRTYTAFDDCGNEAQFSHRIEIVDNTAPVIANVPKDLTLICGEEIPSIPNNVVATDDCDQNVHIYFEESFAEGDNCSQSNTLIRTWTAMDNCGNTSVTSQRIEMTLDTESPVLLSPVTPELTIACGEEIVFEEPNFIDNCSSIDLLFNDNIQTDACEQIYVRTWTASDACGNATTASQKITIVDNVSPAILDVLENQVMSYDEFLNYTVPAQLEATDNCSEVSQLLNVIENQDCDNYIISYTYDLTDECGNNSQASFEIHVEDALPSFDLAIPSDVACGDLITIDVTDIVVANYELTWELNDISSTWEIVNIDAGRIEILAGEETAELSLSVQNQLGCTTTQVQTLECSIVNSVRNLDAVNLLTLSPNPVSEMLNVNFESSTAFSAEIRVYDVLGRTIYQEGAGINVGQNQFDINAANFDNGTYILEIATEQGSKIEKFMKF